MTTTSPINALPSPDDSSPNDPPIHFNALAQQLDTRLVPRFASTAARDTAIPSPSDGQVCWVGSREYAHVNGAWEAQARFRGTGTTLPSSPIDGDAYYHTTYRCTMRYRGGTWRQADLAIVTSDSDRSGFSSAITAAGLTLHDGFQVWQTDVDALFTATGSGATLQRLPGSATLLVTNPATGASGALTAGGSHQARSIAIPAHSPGRLHMRSYAVWHGGAAGTSSAAVFSLQTPSGTDVAGSPVRSKDNSSGAPIPVTCEGYFWSDGSARTLYLTANVEANSQAITVDECAFSVWLL